MKHATDQREAGLAVARSGGKQPEIVEDHSIESTKRGEVAESGGTKGEQQTSF